MQFIRGGFVSSQYDHIHTVAEICVFAKAFNYAMKEKRIISERTFVEPIHKRHSLRAFATVELQDKPCRLSRSRWDRGPENENTSSMSIHPKNSRRVHLLATREQTVSYF